MTRAARIAWFATAPLVCLIVYWRASISWFQNDDFAWLALPLRAKTPGGLTYALFHPAAQGTIRVLSERVFFLTFSSLFGLHALPYHLWALATWFGALTLAAVIGARLTGSRAAGLLAAVLWTTSPDLTGPMCWASSYNELLCAFLVLLAFYARLRWIESGRGAWMALEWAAYLAGFGALEIIVMYPAVAALHAWCMARKKFRSTLPLFIPAGIFTAAHFFLIPKHPGDFYQIIVDWRLPGTLFEYVKWALAPSEAGRWIRHGRRYGEVVATLAGVALLAFAVFRWKRRDLVGIFSLGWFLLLLAPVLPLPNHFVEFYLTLPLLGLAWLGGWGIVCGWRAGGTVRAASLLIATLFIGISIVEAERFSRWYQERSANLRTVVLGIRDSAQGHPGRAFLLQGVDDNLFQSGFQENPFRLFDVEKVYLIPGSEQGIEARADLGGLTPFQISSAAALTMIERGQAVVFHVSKDRLTDITPSYQAILRTNPGATRRDFVDVGDPFYAPQLGPTWYRANKGFRWMPKSATVRIAAPKSAAERLYINGYVPTPVIEAGPLTIRYLVGGREIGACTLRGEGTFAFNYPLPPELVEQQEIEITIEVSRVLHVPTDTREFGAVFGTFAIR